MDDANTCRITRERLFGKCIYLVNRHSAAEKVLSERLVTRHTLREDTRFGVSGFFTTGTSNYFPESSPEPIFRQNIPMWPDAPTG